MASAPMAGRDEGRRQAPTVVPTFPKGAPILKRIAAVAVVVPVLAILAGVAQHGQEQADRSDAVICQLRHC